MGNFADNLHRNPLPHPRPTAIDLSNNYYILGNQPREMLEVRELGSDAPTSGLYLKEDKENKCNTPILSLVKKAELVDAGILRTMLGDGKLKTTDPNNRRNVNSAASPPDQSSEFPPSNRSSTQLSTFADSQDTSLNQRHSQLGQASGPPQGLGFALTGNTSLEPVQSPLQKQHSMAEQIAYQEVSAESTRHKLPVESDSQSEERLNDRYHAAGVPAPQTYA